MENNISFALGRIGVIDSKFVSFLSSSFILVKTVYYSSTWASSWIVDYFIIFKNSIPYSFVCDSYIGCALSMAFFQKPMDVRKLFLTLASILHHAHYKTLTQNGSIISRLIVVNTMFSTISKKTDCQVSKKSM
jgi:hypothetical protein